ncbi:NAD-dependent epimerase/dehydratase family protein [Acidobacteria bacterium AH-259-D05]|nr:NAD-dependent epimerase/dehydratase family protein [Acidobacteria bacterium AH-259-D05]
MNSISLLVTGGSGMLGRALKQILPQAVYLSRQDADLRNLPEVLQLFEKSRPSHVIHLAASIGGVKANKNNNLEFLSNNLMIDTNVLHAAVRHKTQRLLAVLSGCSYSFYEERATTERDLHDGLPFEGNLGYGYAKRVLDVHCHLVKEQYGLEFGTITPVTMFGPYDNFDLEEGHVVGALIHKCLLAKGASAEFEVWGDGTAVRQFVYAPDVAKLLAELLLRKETDGIIVAADEGIAVKDLAETIARIIGFKGPIKYDDSRPVGLQRKVLQSERFSQMFPAFQFTPMEEALSATVDWFRKSLTSSLTGTTQS